MPYTSSAAVMADIATRIDALTPSEQVGDDDRFHCQVDVKTSLTGSRAVLISGMGATRKFGSGRTCRDWEAVLTVEAYYLNVPTEHGQPTVMQRAVRDCEDVLADLYGWAADTDGINHLDADPAPVMDDGTGEIFWTRTIRVEFQRG